MKVIAFIFAAFSYAFLPAQTIVPGGSVSGIWTLSGSPYLVQGSVLIPNDSTLTIQPGVVINFQAGSHKVYVKGRLVAVGSLTDSIVFTTSDTSAGWRGIRFDKPSLNNDSSLLKYCVLAYGKAIAPDINGGALCINKFSKVVVSNCRIHSCYAAGQGGAIFLDSSNALIKNNIIENNRAASEGGGIYVGGCPVIHQNTISNNTSGASGGGIFTVEPQNWFLTYTPIITENMIANNSCIANGGGACISDSLIFKSNSVLKNSAADGGGIAIMYNSHYRQIVLDSNDISRNFSSASGGGLFVKTKVLIIHNTISYNVCSYQGGGVFLDGGGYASVLLNYNRITNNHADWEGGGVYLRDDFNNCIRLSDNSICNNWSFNGGAIFFYNGSSMFTNNTIANNGSYHCALYLRNASNPSFKNSIFWGNNASNGTLLALTDEQCDPNFLNCNVEGTDSSFNTNSFFYTGAYQNNISFDPLFVSPSAGADTSFNGLISDWSLLALSPCIDAGDPSYVAPATDLAGNPRVSGSIIDMGAYEFQKAGGIIDPLVNNEFVIAPNPTNGWFSVHCTRPGGLKLFDITGRELLSTHFEALIPLQMNISFLSNGIYVVQAATNEGVYSMKIIKK